MWRGALSNPKLTSFSKLFHRNFCSEIFVSRLSHYTTEDDLKSTFSRFGKIKEVRLVRDEKTQRLKGYAFVSFESHTAAEEAVKGMDKRATEKDGKYQIMHSASASLLFRSINDKSIIRSLVRSEVAYLAKREASPTNSSKDFRRVIKEEIDWLELRSDIVKH